jgi:feruloyl-CoA synthase
VFNPYDDARVIGLPIPGVTIKLSPDPGGKRELRVGGPNVSPGYYRNDQATTRAFDDEGYFRTGDAGACSGDTAESGLVFAGRIGEDFKLTSGAWVQNSRLRESINRRCQPLIIEVVVAAPDHDYLTAMLFPNVPALRAEFPSSSAAAPDDGDFLCSEEIVDHFAGAIAAHNADEPGSSRRFERFTLLGSPPDLDRNETTDKGYINQHAVLEARCKIVEDLYKEPPPPGVYIVPERRDP